MESFLWSDRAEFASYYDDSLIEKYLGCKDAFEPLGSNVLLRMYVPDEDLLMAGKPTSTGDRLTKAGLIIPQKMVENTMYDHRIGQVLKLGPDAYNDMEKFPTGPYCKPGDWCIFWRSNITYSVFHDEDGTPIHLGTCPDSALSARAKDPVRLDSKFYRGKS